MRNASFASWAYKTACGILASALVTAAVFTNVYAGEGVTVTVDGKPIGLGREPLVSNGYVMVQASEIADAMGWKVLLNSSEAVKLIKSVKYTDGVKEYLFSSHACTLNFSRMKLSRSIMVGVGNFYDTEDDHNIPLNSGPIVSGDETFVSIRDLANCMYSSVAWDGSSRTVSIASGPVPYYDGQGLPNKEALLEEVRAYYKAEDVLTKTGEPRAPKPQFPPLLVSEDELKFKPAGTMGTAPPVGSIPANILLPGETDVTTSHSFYEPYKSNISSGCNWYSYGRFYETTGLALPFEYRNGTLGKLKDIEADSPDYIKVERDAGKAVSGCIGIFVGKTPEDSGHSLFVECVERDAAGQPVNIYYTDSNYAHTGYYDAGQDAKVVKVPFEKFSKNLYRSKLFDGYIIPAA